MNRVFVISDTHFGHKRVIEFEPIARPFATIEDHDRSLVERWNATVKPKDTVWHLGDVFFGKDGHAVLASLHGLKKLVLGNHDHYPLAVYQQYFSKIFGAAEFGGCILTHVPVHPCQMESRYKRNLHGHMHSKSVPDDRYVCVSVEHTGLAPVLMDTAIHYGFFTIREAVTLRDSIRSGELDADTYRRTVSAIYREERIAESIANGPEFWYNVFTLPDGSYRAARENVRHNLPLRLRR